MYGPDRDRPCPMCTNLLGPLDANAEERNILKKSIQNQHLTLLTFR